MNLLNVLLIFLVLIFSSGCATIMHGKTQDISVTTNPAGADILVDSQKHYQSPAMLSMSRKDGHIVEISKEGYQPETVEIGQTMSLATFGDVLAGGIIGYTVDAITGAQCQLVPDKINVTLEPSNEIIKKMDGMTIIYSR